MSETMKVPGEECPRMAQYTESVENREKGLVGKQIFLEGNSLKPCNENRLMGKCDGTIFTYSCMVRKLGIVNTHNKIIGGDKVC